MAIVKKCIRY